MADIELEPIEELICELLTKIADERPELCSDVYITGGWVRDKIMKVPSKDIDICVEECFMKPLISRMVSSLSILRRTDEYTLHRCVTGPNFKIEQEPISGYEVQVLYIYDTKGDMRSVDVRKLRNDKVEADVYTRDFTINSLYYSVKQKKVIDPNANDQGLVDIENKMLRCVGTINETFDNSQSRYFRLLRFAVKLSFAIDEEILAHVKALDFKKDIYVN